MTSPSASPSSASGLGRSQPSLKRLSYPDDEITGEFPPSTLGRPEPPAAVAPTRAMLVLLTGLNAGQVFALDAPETVLGRGHGAHVQLDDPSISRQHTRILRGPAGFFVEDMGSRNGTFRNGERVLRAALSSGDRIHVGPTLALRFQLADEAEETLARQLYEASTRDPLTRAYNRRYFAERLKAETAFARRHGTRVSAILFDVDHFKRVNDTHGHKAGDEVLRAISVAVQATIRSEDVFARYGGEEFALLVRGIDHAGATAFAERLRKGIARLEIPHAGEALRVTISAGVATFPDAPTGEDLMLLADKRMYRAKQSGRNSVCA